MIIKSFKLFNIKKIFNLYKKTEDSKIKYKKIGIILTAVLIGCMSYLGISSKSKVISTMSVPVSNKTIVLDAGHGR